MAFPIRRHGMSVEEYLARERDAEVRHEYLAGEVWAMAGGSERHNTITLNIASFFHGVLRNSPCKAYMSDMKVHLRTREAGFEELFYYPDVMVCCDPRESAPYYREHPCLIVEVLSPATARTDLREKLWAYKTISSLQGYLVVSQENRELTLYRRDNDWMPECWVEGELPLPCIDEPLAVASVYAKVEVTG